MKRILIREIDRLYSKIHKGKYVSEYIIYLMENDIKLKAISVIGEELKNEYTKGMFLLNKFDTNIAEEIIQEVSFEEVIKNQ